MILTMFFWLLMGVSTAYFAQQRGRNPYIWFAIGIFFGLLGLLFVFLLPIVNVNEEMNDSIAEKESFVPLLSQKSHEFLIKDWFYLDSQNKQQGPIPFNALKKMFEGEELKRNTFVWSEGMSDWKKIEEFGELKDVLAE